MLEYVPLISLSMNFIGALMITYSIGVYTRGGSVLLMGKHAIVNLHPAWLKIGVALLIVGFSLQLISEIIKLCSN